MKLSALAAQYIAYKQSMGMRFHTEARTLRSFCRTMGDVFMAEITASGVQAYIAGTGPVTRFWHRKHEVLRGFYRFAMARGYATSSPLPKIIPKPCGLLRRGIGCGDLPRSGHGGDLAGPPVARMGPTAAGSDAAHLLDALIEQKWDMGHGAFLGAPPVIPWWGAPRQGKNAGSAKINGIKRRWSGWSAGSARKTYSKRPALPAYLALGLAHTGPVLQNPTRQPPPCPKSRGAPHSCAIGAPRGGVPDTDESDKSDKTRSQRLPCGRSDGNFF